MSSVDRQDSKKSTGQYQNSETGQAEAGQDAQSEGMSSDGRLVTGPETQEKAIEKETGQIAVGTATADRNVSVAEGDKSQAIDAFIDKVAEISMSRIDVDIKNILGSIDAISAKAMIFAVLISVVITLSLVLWPVAIVFSVVLLVGIGISMTKLVVSHLNNKQAALSIIKNFAKNLLEEYPDDNYQLALDRLEELVTSKEFYLQVKTFREELKIILDPENFDRNYKNATDVTQELLTFIFNFIEKDMSPDELTTFKEAKEKYLNKLLKNEDAGKELLDSMVRVNFSSKQQDKAIEHAIGLKKASLMSSKQRDVDAAFYRGIKAYLDKDQNTPPLKL
jgi:hypothetical protein